MHELSVTESILSIALRYAEQAHAVRVTDLYLVIGQLATIVDDSVQFYWDIISKNTIAEGAILHFRRLPIELLCQECGNRYSPGGEDFACPDCQSENIRVLSGEEFFLQFDPGGRILRLSEVLMPQRITIVEQILSANDHLAQENRLLLDRARVFAINVMASPGAGKTSLILRTIEALAPRLRLAVVEGDTAPVTIDADKVTSRGVPAVQINTGGGCHLDAVMLQAALPQLNLSEIDLMIVENVGNLICPANFRLGTHRNILIASVPEGDDKPYKYPGVYRGVDALVINKIDLLPYVPFDMDYFRRGVEMLNPGLVTFPLSCRTGVGLDAWTEWLATQAAAQAAAARGSC